MKSVTLLIPCYNEEGNVSNLLRRLKLVCASFVDLEWRLLFVNDGSTDRTLELLQELIHKDCSWCKASIIDFARNFGKEAALIAGFDHFEGDCCIVMDADLQHPPEVLPEMIRTWCDGADLVSATRRFQAGSQGFQKLPSRLFYRVFRSTSKLNIALDSSDFRLLDRAVVNAICDCRESIRFSKGFFAWAGFTNSIIYYDQPERVHGVAKWSSWRLWNYGLDGIFNFTTAPLRVWSYLGLVITAISFGFGFAAFINTLLHGVDVPGYASIFIAVTFLGGIQLVGIGVLGEYIGRTYLEVKRRPLYLIREIHQT